jgi:hypothetical protein
MAEVAKKKGMPLFKVITPGGFEIHFLHEKGYGKACEVDRGASPATRRRCDPPPADHPFTGLKTTIQAVVVLHMMPVSNASGHPGTPTECSAAFKASAHASSAPRADASSPLAQELVVREVEDEDTASTMDQQELVGVVEAAANVEPHLAQEALAEKNDANAAVFLLPKRQEEAKLVAVQEGKAGQGAAQPRNTSSAGAVGRAAKPHTAGQLQRRKQQQQQQQQSGKEPNHSQADEVRCSARELPATRRWSNPRAIPRARIREGHSAPTMSRCTARSRGSSSHLVAGNARQVHRIATICPMTSSDAGNSIPSHRQHHRDERTHLRTSADCTACLCRLLTGWTLHDAATSVTEHTDGG